MVALVECKGQVKRFACLVVQRTFSVQQGRCVFCESVESVASSAMQQRNDVNPELSHRSISSCGSSIGECRIKFIKSIQCNWNSFEPVSTLDFRFTFISEALENVPANHHFRRFRVSEAFRCFFLSHSLAGCWKRGLNSRPSGTGNVENGKFERATQPGNAQKHACDGVIQTLKTLKKWARATLSATRPHVGIVAQTFRPRKCSIYYLIIPISAGSLPCPDSEEGDQPAG